MSGKDDIEMYVAQPGQGMQQPAYAYNPGMGGGALPIVVQPGAAPQMAGTWAAAPITVISNCPPGLEFLNGREKVIIKERQTTAEILVSIELPNQYSVLSPSGEHLYHIMEEPRYLQGQLIGSERGFRMQVIDGYRRVAFTIRRPLNICASSACACCGCCQHVGKVEGAGMLYGTMHTRQSCCSAALTILDEAGNEIMMIDGPCGCCNYCCSDAEFQLKSTSTGAVVGNIKRKYKGCCKSTFTKRNEFHVEFPADMDVRTKANVIGACIMIDFEQFENNKHNREIHNA